MFSTPEKNNLHCSLSASHYKCDSCRMECQDFKESEHAMRREHHSGTVSVGIGDFLFICLSKAAPERKATEQVKIESPHLGLWLGAEGPKLGQNLTLLAVQCPVLPPSTATFGTGAAAGKWGQEKWSNPPLVYAGKPLPNAVMARVEQATQSSTQKTKAASLFYT